MKLTVATIGAPVSRAAGIVAPASQWREECYRAGRARNAEAGSLAQRDRQ